MAQDGVPNPTADAGSEPAPAPVAPPPPVPPPDPAPAADPPSRIVPTGLASSLSSLVGRFEPGSADSPPAPNPVQAMDDACEATMTGAHAAPPPMAAFRPPSTVDATIDAAQHDEVDETFAGNTGKLPAALPQGGGVFGRYMIQNEIARGAMGVVYRAFDPVLRRMVALKVMIGAEASTEEMKRRFQREASLAARVRHPNIVQIYDVGEVDGKLYYTMELIEGDSLQAILRRQNRLAPRIALKIARDAARALHAAHEQNLVHRDIKPANIMITSRERFQGEAPAAEDTWVQIGEKRTSSFRVLVTDFGIAKDVTSQTLMTRAGSVVGTPAYMSPEQAGSPDKLGAKSDLYSLSVVLYQSLCGQCPFMDADPVRLLAQVIQKDPPPLRSKAPDLHPDLETIVHKAMMRDPARRYASAGEFADDLDRYLTGEVIHAKPASLGYRLWRKAVVYREVVLPLAAALLVAVGAVLYLTAWPRLLAHRAAQREAEARAARASDARARLAQAEARLTAGEAAAAIADAQGIVAAYADHARRGEPLPLPDAHDLLARAFAAKGEPGHALLERYRAWRAALAAPDSERWLLRTARELVERRRYDEAAAILRRLLRRSVPDEVAAEAHYWIGRATEGGGDFAVALRHLVRATEGYALPFELRGECEQHRAFCAALAGETALPVRAWTLGQADLDGDGKPELTATADNGFFFGTVENGAFVERARLAMKPSGPWTLFHHAVLPLPDAAHPTVVVAGGDANQHRGDLRLLRWDGAQLAEVAADLLESTVGSLTALDVEGDGRNELLVGTVTYERALRVYDWDEAARRLTLRVRLPIGGEVRGIHALDFDGDGTDEIAVFAAEWGAYGVRVFGWDRTRRAFEHKAHTIVGPVSSVIRLDRQDKPPRFVVGVAWESRMVSPLRVRDGDEEFEKTYAAPGAYVLEPQADFGFTRKPLVAHGWAEASSGGAWIARIRGRAGDFLWIKLSEPAPAAAANAAHVGGIYVHRTGEDLREFCTLVPRPGSRIQMGAWLNGLDVDRDGQEEVVVPTDRTVVILDAVPDAAGGAADPAASAPAAALSAEAEGTPLLDFAADAERVGLHDEALSCWTEATQSPLPRVELERAFHGRMRCLLALGRAAEAADLAEECAARHPALEASVLREGARLLDEACRWEPALRLARRLLHAVELGAEERGRAARHVEQLERVAHMPQRLVLLGKDAAPVDWLATSPLLLNPRADGGWTLHVPSADQGLVAAVLPNLSEPWRLVGEMQPESHSWAVGMRVGVVGFDPAAGRPTGGMYGVNFSAGGDGGLPQYTLDVHSEHVNLPWAEQRLDDRSGLWPRTIRFRLTHALHRERLHAELTGLDEGDAVREVARPALVQRGGVLLAGVQVTSSGEQGWFASWRIDRLEAWAASDRWQPVAFTPGTAAEFLMLANGRRLRGTPEEAGRLYDQAVALADLEAQKEEAAKAQGLPVTWDRGSIGDLARWAAVDARLWRGLLRADRGDGEAARADLRAAWERSSERVQTLLRRHAVALRSRPREAAALRALWHDVAGNPHGDQRLAYAQHTVEAICPEAVEVLFEDLRVDVVECLGIPKVAEPGAGHAAGVQAGDLLLTVDGRTVRRPADLRAAMAEATAAGRAEVAFGLLRRGQPVELRLPVGDPGVALEPVRMMKFGRR